MSLSQDPPYSIHYASEYHCFAYDRALAKRNTRLIIRLRGDFIKIYSANVYTLNSITLICIFMKVILRNAFILFHPKS